MKKQILLTPGPTTIPERVARRMSEPILHHRTQEFENLFETTQTGLQRIFATKERVLLLASTGTGSMEAALVNLFRRGDRVVTINGGKFGERWTRLAATYGLEPLEIKLPRGEALLPDELRKALASEKNVRGVLFQASETSTGVKMPTREITEIAHEFGALSVCDGITACGIFPLPMDEWEVDVLLSASQKAMMLPPGLAFLALSPRARQALEHADLPRFYFDLRKEYRSQEKNQTAWTPSTSLIMGLEESLKMTFEEGLEARYNRYERQAAHTRAAVQAMGLELLAKQSPSPAVTAVKVPATIPNGKLIPRIMRERHGVVITGGQDELEGKIFRISHFGHCGMEEIQTGLAALEATLKELGFPK